MFRFQQIRVEEDTKFVVSIILYVRQQDFVILELLSAIRSQEYGSSLLLSRNYIIHRRQKTERSP